MPVAIPFIVAAAALAGAGVSIYSAVKQNEAQDKSLAQAKSQGTEDLKLKRAGLFQQAVQQKQAMAAGYSEHLLKLNKTEQETSDMAAFTRHNSPHRKVSTRHTVTERDNNVRAAFNGALPSRGYGKPTFRAS